MARSLQAGAADGQTLSAPGEEIPVILLVDTDILIDFALDRRPHAAPAGDLLDALERRQATGFIAWHSVANFHYLVVSKQGAPATKAFLLDLLRFVQVAPTSSESVRYAASLPMRDFEDALQAAAAVACGANTIATRNVRDYARAPVRATTPTILLKELIK
jgi:predicted nucleic acid-binding protein